MLVRQLTTAALAVPNSFNKSVSWRFPRQTDRHDQIIWFKRFINRIPAARKQVDQRY